MKSAELQSFTTGTHSLTHTLIHFPKLYKVYYDILNSGKLSYFLKGRPL